MLLSSAYASVVALTDGPLIPDMLGGAEAVADIFMGRTTAVGVGVDSAIMADWAAGRGVTLELEGILVGGIPTVGL